LETGAIQTSMKTNTMSAMQDKSTRQTAVTASTDSHQLREAITAAEWLCSSFRLTSTAARSLAAATHAAAAPAAAVPCSTHTHTA
jgi:hypothetical protein